MKKIFVTIPWFNPAFKAGGPVRSVHNMICELNKDFEFYIFCSSKDVDSTDISVKALNTWIDFELNTKVWYQYPSNSFKNINDQFKKIKPDMLYIVGLFSFEYNIYPYFILKSRLKILSVRGMLHPGALSQKPLKKKLFLSLFKILLDRKCTIFQVTDKIEKEFLYQAMGKDVKVKIAGNFPKINPQWENVKSKHGTLRILTVALISPMKNHKLILQALKEIDIQLTYDIVGAVKDIDYWNECLAIIETMPSNITVHIHGEMPPSSLDDFYQNADIFVMPSESENYGHAIFEALSSGLPVITSFNTPWNKLIENKAGINIGLDKNEIKKSILYFAEMPDHDFSTWAVSARNYALSNYNHEELMSSYQQLFLINQ